MGILNFANQCRENKPVDLAGLARTEIYIHIPIATPTA